MPEFPDVPTAKEKGLDVAYGTWRGIAGPKGMPPATVAKLKEVFEKVAQDPQLISAITTLRNAQVDDLILDIRYNGGGYLDIASELGYMIAGPTNIGGRPFERLVFNDKNPSTNPITGQALAPTPFHTTALGFSTTRGTALPTLNLPRVYVITSSNTC